MCDVAGAHLISHTNPYCMNPSAIRAYWKFLQCGILLRSTEIQGLLDIFHVALNLNQTLSQSVTKARRDRAIVKTSESIGGATYRTRD